MKQGPWTRREAVFLKREYPNRQTKLIAADLDRSTGSVGQKALLMGLHKSAAFLSGNASGRLRNGTSTGSAHRFQKGHATWNKGMLGLDIGGKATRFKKGDKPHTWRPIGSERVTFDGILQRKLTDTGSTPRDWKAVHVMVWEEANGPVPPGHVVVFKNGDRTDRALENLECVSRPELMRRNSYHTRYPKEIGLAIQLRGALMRQINQRERNAKQD